MDIFLLSIVQGITEFLPISSSAHLMLLSSWQGISASTPLKLAFHLGTLGAITVYFWRDLSTYIQGVFTLLSQRILTPAFKEGLFLCAATLPAVIAGYAIHRWGGIFEENAISIGINSIIFGGLLIIADQHRQHLTALSFKQSILIGMGQVVALIFPGASRSGSCLTISRLLKVDRRQGIRFTFLLSIPTVFAGVILLLNDATIVYSAGQVTQMLQATAFSFLIAILVIHFILKILTQQGFKYFGVYRIILGLYLLWAA